jgi:dihydrofolate synthase/folylpolyglutamate synthase
VPLWRLGEEIRFRPTRVDRRGSRFDLDLPGRSWRDLELGLLGAHQVANAAIAVAAVARLGERGYPVPDAAIRSALREVRVPGRLEVVREAPLLVLDGAHNPDKMAALAEAIRTIYPGRRVTAVVAFKRGHDVPATVARLAPVIDRAIATTFEAMTDFGSGQAILPAEVGRILAEAGIPAVVVEGNPVAAVARALGDSSSDDVVAVTGSLYLVGAIRRWARTAS